MDVTTRGVLSDGTVYESGRLQERGNIVGGYAEVEDFGVDAWRGEEGGER